ncbi:MAG: hypothetical protein Q8P67_01940 [archaeon]|nr:hypothetical protein [archaeon]
MPAVADPLVEAALFNGRMVNARRNRPPYYWDSHTGSLQCLPRIFLAGRRGSNPLAHALRAEHVRYHVDRQEQARYARQVHALFPDPRGGEGAGGEGPQLTAGVCSMEDHEIKEPKLPRSAFALFAANVFERVEKSILQLEGPQGASHEAIALQIAQLWADLDDKERSYYRGQGEAQRRKWEAELTLFAQRCADRIMRLQPEAAGKFSRYQPAFSLPDDSAATSQAPALQARKEARKYDLSVTCNYCLKSAKSDPYLLTCESCYRHFHAPCLQISETALERILREGVWRCSDCKVCELCRDPGYEASLIFCDRCDHGYHTFCVSPPFHQPPEGLWLCVACEHAPESPEDPFSSLNSALYGRLSDSDQDDADPQEDGDLPPSPEYPTSPESVDSDNPDQRLPTNQKRQTRSSSGNVETHSSKRLHS